MGYLLFRTLGSEFLKSYVVRSVFIDIDCNKRGQTSRFVSGVQIQTICYFKIRIYNCNFMVSIHSYSSVSSRYNLRLNKNSLLSSSEPNSYSEPCGPWTT